MAKSRRSSLGWLDSSYQVAGCAHALLAQELLFNLVSQLLRAANLSMDAPSSGNLMCLQ